MARPGQEMANVNFLRYSSAVFKVARQEVWRVFYWLHHYHHRHRPPAYVGQRLRESEGGMKRIGAKERAVLESQDDPATMDIPLLYRLLQHTCGLRQDGPEFDWTSPRGEDQRQSLEHRLYLIKEERNNLCHRPEQYMHLSDRKLGALLQKLQEWLCHSVQQAGLRSGRPTEEVDDAVASVRDRLVHIQTSVPPSAITPQEFALLARQELQDQWERLSSTWKRLSPPLLHGGAGTQITLNQLLQGLEGEGEKPPQVLAVLGEAGIGKSSLCRQFVEAWLQREAWLQDEAAVELVVEVELRQVFTRDLTHLLQEDLLPQTCLRCQPGEVLRLLRAVRVLWLLDDFEEASADARDLLRRLVKWCRIGNIASHLVLVTCQPEYMEDLKAYLAPAATLCCVTHRGLTEKGLHSLVTTLLQSSQEAAGEGTGGLVEEGKGRDEAKGEEAAGEERMEAGRVREEEVQGEEAQGREEAAGESTVKKGGSGRRISREASVKVRCQAFLKEVSTLNPHLLKELHNPLKLTLAVQLWEGGRLGEAAGATLTRLYNAIQEVLVAKLVVRLRTKTTLTEAEARVRVKRWVATLCEVALAMWGRGRFSVTLDEVAEQLLKDRAMELLLPYTDCFSAFLVLQAGPEPRHGFLHHTQLKVLAAQHVQALLRQDHTSQELLDLLLPGQPTTASTLDHWLGILVLAAASLAAEGGLSEGRAKVLAELLLQCHHCPWLEVLGRTACCPALAQEVRPRLTEEWEVTSATVQAAAVLAAIRAPASITIKLNTSPDKIPHLMQLLHCLAKAPVKVALHNNNSFVTLSPSHCESLLLPLCDPTSPCCLTYFSGVLTAEGCRTLRRQQHNLVSLLAVVLEPAALEELVQLTHNTKHLQEVSIMLDSISRDVPSKPVQPRVGVHLYLMKVQDKEAKAAVAQACRISHTFKSLMVGIASPSTVCRMVRAFGKKRVHTPSLGMVLVTPVLNFLQFYKFGYSSLPLPSNVSPWDVARNWQQTMRMEANFELSPSPWVERHSLDDTIVFNAEDSSGGAG